MTLHIETGHYSTKDVQTLPANSVRFVTDNGKTMFEVHIGQDGQSIEVRAVVFVKVDDTLYGSRLAVCPNASNSITVRTVTYGL